MTIVLAFVAAICFVCAITMNTSSAKADGEQVFGIESVSVYAGTKDNDDTGIKFTAQINKAKYDAIADGSKPVFFGVELSVGGENPMNIIYTVGGDSTAQAGFKKVNFEDSSVYKYTATIMYNEQTLAEELAKDSKFNPKGLSVEKFKASEEFAAYMKAAFKTEITAKAYYQIGDMETAQKIYGDTQLTNSMWGVASKHYVTIGSFEDCEALQTKYFSSVKTEEIESGDIYVQTDGTIVGYTDFDETDTVYLNSIKVEVEQTDNGYKIKDMSAINSTYTVTDKVQFTLVRISADGAFTYVKSLNNDLRYVTLAIDEASDFETFDLDKEYTLSDGSTKVGKVVNGYYVMIADVDAEGTNMGLDHQYYNAGVENGRYNVKNGILGCGFAGIFDGQGHVVKNFVPSVGGVFGRIAKGGAVNNVAFYNATVSSSTTVIAYNAERRSADNSKIPAADAETKFDGLTLAERNNLLRSDTNYITNIYIKLSAETTSVDGVITKNDQYDGNIYTQKIVVDASDCNVGDVYSFYFKNTNGMADAYIDTGVIITEKDAFRAGNGYKVYGNNQGKTSADGKISNNRSVYHTYAEFVADNKKFSDKFSAKIWNVDNGIFFKGLEDEIYADNIYLQDAEGSLYTKAIVTDDASAKFNVVDVYKQPLEIVNFESSNTDVIDYVDGEIKVVNFVMGDYTVSFDVEIGETTKTMTYAINLSGEIINVDSEAIYDSTLNKIYYRDAQGDKQIVSEGDIYFVVGENEYKLTADSVSYMHKSHASFTSANHGALTALNPIIKPYNETATVSIAYNAKADAYTGLKLKVYGSASLHTFTNTVLVTAVIDDATELKNIFNKPDTYYNGYTVASGYGYYYGNITKGVYMLADNIDATSFEFDNSFLNVFDGVLDGRGYNISNLNVSGSETEPGNGLFSAVTKASAIQNIAFTNVIANNGSVFQGNLADYSPYYGTYGIRNGSVKIAGEVKNIWHKNIGCNQYRAQVGLDNASAEVDTTPITDVLTEAFRANMGSCLWTNVYVEVAPETQRLMGVISRQMRNTAMVRANNLVIEYLPTTLNDSEDGSVRGALPYGYNYTSGEYGVLFGGAYNLSAAEVPIKSSTGATTVDAAVVAGEATKTFFTPTGTATRATNAYGALNFSYDGWEADAKYSHRIYIISPVKSVSTVGGAILGTNEKKTEGSTEYQFTLVEAGPYYSYPSEKQRLEIYSNYENATKSGYDTLNSLTSFLGSNTATAKFWNLSESGGYLVWKNLPAKTPAEQA